MGAIWGCRLDKDFEAGGMIAMSQALFAAEVPPMPRGGIFFLSGKNPPRCIRRLPPPTPKK
jgi:hypothetical protein